MNDETNIEQIETILELCRPPLHLLMKIDPDKGTILGDFLSEFALAIKNLESKVYKL